jgi:hypothetical protein
MAAETIGNASTGTYVLLLILGLAMALPALATMTNFQGFRERHLRRALRAQERIRRVPPYRWWARTDPEADRRFGAVMQFLVATVFLLAAVALVLIAVVGLARRAAGG